MQIDDWQNNNQEPKQLVLTNREKQVVLGSILGNSSIIKPAKSLNPHFQMRESISKGGNWIRCKAEELKRLSRKKSFIKDSNSYRWNSISAECFIEFYNLCYENNNKTIKPELLDKLQDYGITCWFMDKGFLNNKYCSIRISRLNQESIDNIKEYFNIIDMPCVIKKFGGSKIINFEEKSRDKFIRLISPCMPAYMRKTT